MSKIMRHLILIAFGLITAGQAPLWSQTVDQILTAVQERKLALVQRDSVDNELRRHAETVQYTSPSTPLDEIEDSELINWGYDLPPFPSSNEIQNLGMKELIDVLNRASREADRLKESYANVDSRLLNQLDGYLGSLAGLPSVGDFNESNLRDKLIQLASLVEQMRTLTWPVEYQSASLTTSLVKSYSPPETAPNPGPTPTVPFLQGGGSDVVISRSRGMANIGSQFGLYTWNGSAGGTDSFMSAGAGTSGVSALRTVVTPSLTGTRMLTGGKIRHNKRGLEFACPISREQCDCLALAPSPNEMVNQ